MKLYMKKNFKKNNDYLTQTVFSNTAETKFNPFKKYYAVVEVDGVEKLYLYDCKFRVQAENYFTKEARKDHGKVLMVSSFK